MNWITRQINKFLWIYRIMERFSYLKKANIVEIIQMKIKLTNLWTSLLQVDSNNNRKQTDLLDNRVLEIVLLSQTFPSRLCRFNQETTQDSNLKEVKFLEKTHYMNCKKNLRLSKRSKSPYRNKNPYHQLKHKKYSN